MLHVATLTVLGAERTAVIMGISTANSREKSHP